MFSPNKTVGLYFCYSHHVGYYRVNGLTFVLVLQSSEKFDVKPGAFLLSFDKI